MSGHRPVHGLDSAACSQNLALNCFLLPDFGALPLVAISTPKVRAWVASLSKRGLSSSRVRQAYGLLAMLLKLAVESNYLAKSPCVGIRIPHVSAREPLPLTEEELQAVAETLAPPEYRLLILVLAYGGLRWGEACALRRRRCDLAQSRVEVAESLAEVSGHFAFGEPKTYARRWVRLPRFVTDQLAEHLRDRVAAGPDALVFTGRGGTLLRNSNFRRRIWQPALLSAGLPASVRLHDYADVRVMPTSQQPSWRHALIAIPSSA